MGVSIVVIGQGAGSPQRIAASMYNSAAQLRAVGWDTLVWDTARYDHGGFFNPAFSTRLTVPTGQGGLYTIKGVLATLVDAPSVPYLEGVRFDLNGASILSLKFVEINFAIEHEFSISIDEELSEGDYVEFLAFNGAANPINTIGGSSRGRFEIRRNPSQ